MDIISLWNAFGYLEGILVTIWIGMMYYGKCWIDSKFQGCKCECNCCAK